MDAESAVKVIHREGKVLQGENCIRAAAYCRVSTASEVQESSLSLQMEAFRHIIEQHPGWELAGIYADSGLTGTMSETRPEFMRMMEDARQGKIDYILVKSVSRFARNTADSLRYTRELAEMGIGVYFEKEGIDTASFASEFMLTIFSAFAQEESHSISENIKRGLRNRYRIGQVPWYTVYGYRKGWVIEEKEAVIIRRIFSLYGEGMCSKDIAERLNKENVPSPRRGALWSKTVILGILRNEKYAGDVKLQKTYVENFMTHRRVSNKDAKIDQYYKADNHAPIVSRELYEAAQRMLAMRRPGCGEVLYPYYGLLRCPFCGKLMIKIWTGGTARQSAWTCGGADPEELLSRRTSCPTYLLQEHLLDRSVRKAVLALDIGESCNFPFYRSITDAQEALKERDQLSFGQLHSLMDAVSLDGWENLRIQWKTGREESVPLAYQRPSEAVMPDLQKDLQVQNRRALLEGFRRKQKRALSYRVITTDGSRFGVPLVLRGEQ